MQSKKICFIGRHNFPRHCWRNIVYRLERARPGELEGFRQQTSLRAIRAIANADVVYARNCPEKTDDRGLARLQRMITRVDDGSRLIVNPQDCFLNADSKDRAFSGWSGAGLLCPRHWVLPIDSDPRDVVDQVRELLQAESRILLRTNNETRSLGLYVVDRDTAADRIVEAVHDLKHRVDRLRRTRSDTRAIAVQYADTRDADGLAILARAFVLFDRIIGYFAVVSDKLQFRVSSMGPELFDRFVAANQRLREIIEDPQRSSEITRSVSCLGNNIGAVEFLIRADGRPLFLETNPLWGGVPGPYAFGNDEFTKLMQQTEDFWSTELPNIADNLNVVPFYRDMYESIAARADQGARRTGSQHLITPHRPLAA